MMQKPTPRPASPLVPSRHESQQAPAAGKRQEIVDRRHAEMARDLADYAARQRSWLRQAFPTKLDRLLDNDLLQSATTICEYQQQFLELSCKAWYESTKAEYDDWLKAIRADRREQYIAYITPKLVTVRATIEKTKDDFIAQIRKSDEAANQLSDTPAFQKIVMEQIEQDFRSVLKTLADLYGGFQEIVAQTLQDIEAPRRRRA